MRGLPGPMGSMPDSEGRPFMGVGRRGQNRSPSDTAITPTAVATTNNTISGKYSANIRPLHSARLSTRFSPGRVRRVYHEQFDLSITNMSIVAIHAIVVARLLRIPQY